ncbi:MAG: sulfatase [Flavobacteriales bacterium]|nr:MAG: sulfatase [Flavobacteriales bacterium]
MTKNLKTFIFLACVFFCFNACKETSQLSTKLNKSPNILFIAIDDLRPDLGVYGNKIVKSPNLDKLAKESVLFTNHYAQVPSCGPSRFCLLTGNRPVSVNQLNNNIAEKEISDQPEKTIPETFIHHLRRNGYYTVGIGKISHSADGLVYGYEEEPSNKRELPYSWDEMIFNSGKWGTGWNAFFGYANGENRQSLNKKVEHYEKAAVDDNGYPDGLTAELAIKKLSELKNKAKPFFLGVGFFKPHLPFNSPEKYWSLYNRDSIEIAANPDIPKNINKASLSTNGEINQYQLGVELPTLDQPVSDAYAKKLRHAYYAAVSYTDRQVGKVLDELKKLGLDKNTIVVVWSDHGWHLGEQRRWGKHTLFENALKSPLIIKIPQLSTTPKKVNTIVETIDIYPSLMELCNVKIAHQIDGESFVKYIKQNMDKNDEVAYSYFNNGITVRTNKYRLTKYFRSQKPNIELYNHDNDPLETVNIARENMDLVNSLMPILEKGNTGLYEKK